MPKKRVKAVGSDSKTLATIIHILSVITWFVTPLIVLYSSSDKKTLAHAKNALNWQISFTIYIIISLALTPVVVGYILLPLVFLINLTFCFIAAIKASNNVVWSYPASIKFFKTNP